MRALLAGVAIASLWTVAAHAAAINTFTNGSFEVGTDPGDSFIEINAPDLKTISGWTVDSGSIDYIGTYWQAAEGSRSIDLSGSGPGRISQTFFTTPGQTYVVTFSIAGNPEGAPAVKELNAEVNSVVTSDVADPLFSFNASGKTKSNMGWTDVSFTFVGSGQDNLSFAENSPGAYGAALDNVRVGTVPLPASAPMFGAALLVLGGLGYAAKRKAAAAA